MAGGTRSESQHCCTSQAHSCASWFIEQKSIMVTCWEKPRGKKKYFSFLWWFFLPMTYCACYDLLFSPFLFNNDVISLWDTQKTILKLQHFFHRHIKRQRYIYGEPPFSYSNKREFIADIKNILYNFEKHMWKSDLIHYYKLIKNR